jgi:hypothetical protein
VIVVYARLVQLDRHTGPFVPEAVTGEISPVRYSFQENRGGVRESG